MHGNTLLKRLFSAGGGAIAAAEQEVSRSEPSYLTRQEANAIVTELVETDEDGQLIPPVVTHPACPQRIYVALATSLPEEQHVLSCAGLCYIQLLDDPGLEGRVRVTALPSHFESASRCKVQALSLREEQLHQMLPWDRTLQRLETCCVREVLQAYVSSISGREIVAHPYVLDADGLPVQTLASVGQSEPADVVGETLPEQVFVSADLALDLASQLTTHGKQGQKTTCSPRFFWLKAIITMLEKRQQLSTFETMFLRMVRHLKKPWHGGFQVQATPVRKEKTCLGWSLLLGFPQTTLRAWGF